MKKTFYITTPIYYVNDIASIGHAYTTISADIIARWHRLNNDKVFFLTGLDENSQKTVTAAKKLGVKNIKEYTDDMAKKWKNVWKVLNISNDDFIRTTEGRHKRVVNEFFMKVYRKDDIYKGEYEGLYCEGCEDFKKENELIEGRCPYHKTEPKKISEENYFFKLSKYENKVLDYINKNPEFIRPESRRNEVISFIKNGLKDISISRPDVEWGIELPIDKKHRYWTWFDALVNYISGAENYWPADLQLMAKDIIKFHCIIWPAMLMSAGYKLPKHIFAHGFLTIDGEKMSKSLGNAINPLYLSEKYGNDPLRFILIREIPFGQDGDFSEEALKDRLNNELANDLGNLLSRVLTICEKNFNGKIKKSVVDKKLSNNLNLEKINDLMLNYKLTEALNEIWSFVKSCNKHINDEKLWEMEKDNQVKHLYSLLESIRISALLLSPFIPETSEKIFTQLNVKSSLIKEAKFGLIKQYSVKKGEVLFNKIK